MQQLALVGCVALAFGLGSFYATGQLQAFGAVNLAAGGLSLLLAAGLASRRLRGIGGPESRALLARGALRLLAALALAVGVERAAAFGGWQLDLTRERTYELAAATVEACRALDAPRATLFRDPGDPRIRRTRFLLRTLAQRCPLEVREQVLEDGSFETDRYAVTGSNSILFEVTGEGAGAAGGARGERSAGRFEIVERPLEGAVYEALQRLRRRERTLLGVLRGEGDGDPESAAPGGYSGLAAALASEGYALRSLVTPTLTEVPPEVQGILVLAPERRLPETALAALGTYLARGGRLVALLEPGRATGVETLLAEWGIEALPGVVVDPASGPGLGLAPGLALVAFHYETHPATRGLDRNRMTFLPGALAFRLRKPERDDELRRIVLSSPRAWVEPDPGVLERPGVSLRAPEGEPLDYRSLAAVGRYRRGGHETRIAAFGDADFASNRFLRALYNLDLVLNGLHWTLEREPDIQIRPKIRDTVQFPLPIANTFTTLYGVGLLVPELLLLLGGLTWLRRRAS